MPYSQTLNMYIYWFHAQQLSPKKSCPQSLLKALKNLLMKINLLWANLNGSNLLQPFLFQNQMLIKYVNTF